MQMVTKATTFQERNAHLNSPSKTLKKNQILPRSRRGKRVTGCTTRSTLMVPHKRPYGGNVSTLENEKVENEKVNAQRISNVTLMATPLHF